MKALSRIYVALILFFLYAPVAVMILFSFNLGGSVWVFEGFSFTGIKVLQPTHLCLRHFSIR